MSHGNTLAEQAGYEIGRRMIDAVRARLDDQSAVHRLCTAAMVLCAAEDSPRDAFAGFATAVAPALQKAAEPDKSLANLAARAALAGHTCTMDTAGLITLSRWGRSMTFGDVATASVWLERVTGQKGGA